MKDKICFVVQRYGKEVNGGAELECMQYAERLIQYYDVEVLTTKAIDYQTWKDAYTTEIETINGVLVHRFSVDSQRNMDYFNKLSSKVFQYNASEAEEMEWMRAQGPYSTLLFDYIKQNKDKYMAYIFMTYLYCTTFFGMPPVRERAMLIPTAHDEIPIHLNIFKDFFKLPKCIFYNTKIEQKFVEKTFHNEDVVNNNGEGGVGVDIPKDISSTRFKEKYKCDNFILYIGRIEEHKGCAELFRFFDTYKKRNTTEIKLVLIGKPVMKIPDSRDIISLGFVSDQDKFDAIAACRILVLPSRFESLSMVVLEAMKMFKPVLVHGKCDVVKNHCVRSNGGLYYNNYYEFEGALNYLLTHHDVAEQMGKNGHQYVEKNYKWDIIIEKLRNMIEYIRSEEE